MACPLLWATLKGDRGKVNQWLCRAGVKSEHWAGSLVTHGHIDWVSSGARESLGDGRGIWHWALQRVFDSSWENSSGSDVGVLGRVTFLPRETGIGETIYVNMRKRAGFPLLGLMRYQSTQNWRSAGFLQKSCCDLYANQPVPKSLWAPSFQLQLGRELLLTDSLCWFCESESGLWNAYSTFPTCVPLLGSPQKPGTLR